MAESDKLGPMALDLLQRATIAGIKEDAAELSALVQAVLAPLPALPLDPVLRERTLAVSLLTKDDAARRLLELFASGDVRS